MHPAQDRGDTMTLRFARTQSPSRRFLHRDLLPAQPTLTALLQQRTGKRNLKLQMPGVLKRLAGPPACPIVIAQYKDEFRGVGHEQDLHWALIVITDPTTLSGPSFQAYAQRRRRRPRRASRAHPDCPPTAAGAETTNAPNETSPSALNTAATRTKTKARSQRSRAAATVSAGTMAAAVQAGGFLNRATATMAGLAGTTVAVTPVHS